MKALIDQPELAEDFKLRAVLPLQEIANGDMIYVNHLIKEGDVVKLTPAGINLRGDLRMKVHFSGFLLGYVTIGGVLKEFYEGQAEVWAEVGRFKRKKYLPIQEMQIALHALKLKKVS